MRFLLRHRVNLLFAGLVCAGIAIRWAALPAVSLWDDEWHVVHWSTFPLKHIAEGYFSFYLNQQPLYYLVCFVLFKIAEPTTVLTRLPAFVFGVSSIALCFFAARRHFGTRLARILTILVTFNFFHIRYSSWSKPYSLGILLTVVSLHYFLLEHGTSRSRRNHWKLFAANLLLCLTHLYGLFFVLAEHFLLGFRRSDADGRNSLFRYFKNAHPWQALVLCALTLTRIEIYTRRHGIGYLSTPSPADLGQFYAGYLQYSYGPWSSLLITPVILLLTASLFCGTKAYARLTAVTTPHRCIVFLAILTALCVPAALFFLSLFLPAMFKDRYLFFAFIPLMILLSLVTASAPRWLRRLFPALLVCLSLFSAPQSLLFGRYAHQFDELFRRLKDYDGKVILMTSYSGAKLKFYRRLYRHAFENVLRPKRALKQEQYEGDLLIEFRRHPVEYGKQLRHRLASKGYSLVKQKRLIGNPRSDNYRITRSPA